MLLFICHCVTKWIFRKLESSQCVYRYSMSDTHIHLKLSHEISQTSTPICARVHTVSLPLKMMFNSVLSVIPQPSDVQKINNMPCTGALVVLCVCMWLCVCVCVCVCVFKEASVLILML